jgi:mycoredoxin
LEARRGIAEARASAPASRGKGGRIFRYLISGGLTLNAPEIPPRSAKINSGMEDITMYCTSWCVDCHRTKKFLEDRGVNFVEVNIDEDPDAEDLVFEVNEGRRKVPTIKVGDRFFACSPFDPYQLSSELNIPLNK